MLLSLLEPEFAVGKWGRGEGGEGEEENEDEMPKKISYYSWRKKKLSCIFSYAQVSNNSYTEEWRSVIHCYEYMLSTVIYHCMPMTRHLPILMMTLNVLPLMMRVILAMSGENVNYGWLITGSLSTWEKLSRLFLGLQENWKEPGSFKLRVIGRR